MNLIKKTSGVVAAAAVIFLFALSAHAEVEYSYDKFDNILTISGTGRALPSGKSPSNLNWEFEKWEVAEVIIEDGITEIATDCFNSFYNLNKITIADSVITIGRNAFRCCYSLENIDIPDSVTSIGYLAFEDCSSLKNIRLSDNLTYLETSAFGGCTAIESISIPESLTELKSGTFSRCSSLKNVYIPDSISILGDFVFSSCTSLKHVELPDSVTSIGVGLFADCYAMTDITIPDSVTNISKSALSRISNLQTLTMPGLIELSDAMYEIPSSLTSITVTSDPIEGFAYECDGIRTVNIGPKVKTINPHAFEKCTNLNTVTIENGTTSIARRAFTGCTALKTITIPESVTSIGADAFRDCGKIKDIYYGGSKYDWKHIDTADNNSPLAEAAVHYAKPMPMVYTIDAADISVDKTNNNVTINVSKELDYDGQLITAAYDENGVLINMDCQPLEIETGTSKEITTKPKLENATSIKAWVWEDFNTMLPLSKVSAKETVYQ